MMISNGVEQVFSNFPSEIIACSKRSVEKTTLYFRLVTHQACDVGHVGLRPFLGDDEEDGRLDGAVAGGFLFHLWVSTSSNSDGGIGVFLFFLS
jgi:hypothetical protein